MRSFIKRSGFTAIELLLTLGIITVSVGLSIPMYRQYLIRNDLEIARQNVAQGIQRAKFLSQVSMNDSGWGFSTDALPGRGVLFMGDNYATRDTDFDEMYTLPSTIEVTGLTEVGFSKIDGLPDQTGIITLRALNGEERTISVNLGEEGNVSIPDDWMTICANPYDAEPQTIQVPDSLWEYYEGEGAEMGACGEGGGGEGGGGGFGGGEGPDFDLDGDTITPLSDFSCTLRVLGAALTTSGYDMPITLRVQFGDTPSWVEPYGDWGSPVGSNLNDGEIHTYNCDNHGANYKVDMEGRSWIKKSYWYSGDQDSHWKVYMTKHTINNDNANVYVLQNGDPIPDVPGMEDQASVQEFVQAYLNFDTGLVSLDGNQVLYLWELGTNNLESSAADFQDLVLLLNLEPAS